MNKGIDKKIYSQVEQLANYGVDTIVYSICADVSKGVINKKLKIVKIGIGQSAGLLGKIRREYKINLIIRDIISSLKEQDLIYLRIPYPSLQLSRILKKPRSCKIVIEYQTIEPSEYRLKGKYWYLLVDFLFGDAIRKYTDAIVGVTDEITQYQLHRAVNITKPHITIGNGFDVSSALLRHPPQTPEDSLHLLCVANISRWHGIDRLLQGLATYRGTPRVVLHIVGEGTELPHLQELSCDLGINDRVVYHGFLTGGPLDSVFDQCHIAVGSLGIHRKNLTQTSELKAREYCARGIPYIITVDDPDFPPDFPYILRLPADESPVEIPMIIAFANEVYADPDHPQKMRHYAEEHLDWSSKMKVLKGFLEALVEGKALTSSVL